MRGSGRWSAASTTDHQPDGKRIVGTHPEGLPAAGSASDFESIQVGMDQSDPVEVVILGDDRQAEVDGRGRDQCIGELDHLGDAGLPTGQDVAPTHP